MINTYEHLFLNVSDINITLKQTEYLLLKNDYIISSIDIYNQHLDLSNYWNIFFKNSKYTFKLNFNNNRLDLLTFIISNNSLIVKDSHIGVQNIFSYLEINIDNDILEKFIYELM